MYGDARVITYQLNLILFKIKLNFTLLNDQSIYDFTLLLILLFRLQFLL